MLNGIFLVVVVLSLLLAAATGQMEPLAQALLDDAKKAVTLALGLVGVMAFFLGLMRVAQDAGLLRVIARLIAPLMRRLFPSVPVDHPAMSAMILNISSNMLGLANAATPFGIKAMEELDRLNGRKGTATDAMVLFLAINTSGLALLPTGVVSLRASLGSQDAMAILLPTWIASGCATLVGVSAALLLSRLPSVRATAPPAVAPSSDVASGPTEADAPSSPGASRARLLVAAIVCGTFVWLAARYAWGALASAPVSEVIKRLMSSWVLGALVGGLLLYGWSRGVKVYESLVEGAKEGFQVALRIIPYLVAILVMIAMLRAAGGIDLLVALLSPLTERIGMPAEALPMALLRPLSGSGAYGVMASVMETHGPDSLIGTMVSTFQGSTETTFYVLAVYCGAVGVTRTRHTLAACLAADVAGLLTATWVVRLLFG